MLGLLLPSTTLMPFYNNNYQLTLAPESKALDTKAFMYLVLGVVMP